MAGPKRDPRSEDRLYCPGYGPNGFIGLFDEPEDERDGEDKPREGEEVCVSMT